MNLWHPKFRKVASVLMMAWGLALVAGIVWSAFRVAPAFAEGNQNIENVGITAAKLNLEVAGGTIPGVAPNPPKAGAKALDFIHSEILTPYVKMALLSLLVNVLEFVLNTLAYDAAVALASGGKAQGTLFTSDSPEQAWMNFGLDAAGEAVGTLSQSFNESDWAQNIGLKFDACAPDVEITFALQIGIQGMYDRPEPACRWKDIAGNWQGFIGEYRDKYDNASEMQLRDIAKSVLKPGESSLSAAVGISMWTHEESLQQKNNLFATMLAKNGFKDVVDPTTGLVMTPSTILQSQFESRLLKAQEGPENSFDLAAANSELLVGMVASVSQTFLNTLLSQLIKNIYEGMFDPTPYVNPFEELSADIPGREEAEARFSQMLRTQPIVISDYNVLSEFVVCISSGSILRQANNCVMDANFAAAVVRSDTQPGGMTIAEAIDAGLLHGDWPLISPDDLTRNQDPYCYTYGYCYGNLVKLRKARIIPIGWELAAASPKNSESRPVTLQEVIDGFDDCDSDGTIDDETHPWCHLIDPNWVLKYPESQCNAQVSGEILTSQFSPGRGSTCVDAPSCIAEDEDGQCVGGYGYCTREKNVWRFRGDECPEEYATCLSFENLSTGEDSDFLLNTVDFNGCNSGNAGCMWYRTSKYFDDMGTADDEADDVYSFLPTGETYLLTGAENRDNDFFYNGSGRALYSYDTGAATYDYSTYAFEDRVYFNNNVTACSASDAGCSRLYAASDGLSLNFIRNGSFEMDAENNNIADEWTVSGATYDEAGSNAAYGITGYGLTGDRLVQEGITLQPGVFYSLSFYAKDDADAPSGEAEVTLDFLASDGSAVDFSGYSMDCLLDDDDTVFLPTSSLSNNYESFDCTFTTPLLDDPLLDLVATLTVFGETTGAWVDALQLEPGTSATDYHDGYSDTSPTETYLTLPPDYLGCTGEATDPAECDSYAPLCSATDVGCNLYTPSAGGPSVPAVLSSLDLCPDECSGYTTYKQEATLYDAEDFPLYFIADTASACTEDFVGCDEFTNLENENIESYTYLRACATPEMDPGSPYFTWEGSDMAGYELVSWQLVQSNLGDSDTLTFVEAGVDGEVNVGQAPCSRWNVVSEDTITCADNASDIEAQDDCNEHDDIFSNPDCREFFDTDGNIHYRLWSETVTVADDCTAYRKTESNETDCNASSGFYTAAGECRYFGYVPESDSCPDAFAGCRKYTGGAGRNSVTVYEDDVEDGDVAEYETLNAAIAVSNESVATDGHSMRVEASALGGAVDTLWDPSLNSGTLDDLLVADKTYILRFWAKGSGDVSAMFIENGGLGDVDPLGTVSLNGSWKLYELGPLDTVGLNAFDDTAILRWSAQANVIFYLDNIELVQAEENIALIKDSWVTPSTCDISPAGAASPQYYLGCEEYSDPEGAAHYIYRFSRLCGSDAVGCEAYYDTQNSESPYPEIYNVSCYLSSSREASANVTSSTPCAMDNETVCTIPPGANTCQFDLTGALPVPLPSNIALGPAARIVPKDEVVYLIDDGSAECSSSAMGCTEVGAPTMSQDRTVVEGFDPAYLIDLPDDYGNILCEAEALFCEEWSTTQDGNYNFKDPGEQTCEYKTNVNADSAVYSGWFRTGTNEFCYGTGACSEDPAVTCSTDAECAAEGAGTCLVTDGSFIEGGNFSGVWRNGDPDYDGWTAACGRQYDLCTAFTDPLDTGEGENPEGRDYFYKDNASIDESNLSSAERCNGQVSLNQGCVVMADGNEVTFSYSSSSSYIASERADKLFGDAPRSLQDPISCADPDNADITTAAGDIVNLCTQRCAYEVAAGTDILNAVVEGPVTSGGIDTYYGSSCLDSSDCPVIEDVLRNDVAGACADVAGTAYELSNDVNRVIKVYRDRECAEWLACSSAGPATWDEATYTYKDICDSIDLCTEYAGSGDSNFCAQWKTREPIVLSDEQYSARDTSWYGMEYSGYSIPNELPVEVLDQVNLNPTGKHCVNYATDPPTVLDVTCASDDDCEGAAQLCEELEPDYRLGYVAGACEGDNGTDCTVGFCENSGYACSGSDDSLCEVGEECITGYCETPSPSAEYCDEDSDCSGTYDTCRSNICTEVAGSCYSESDCGVLADCVASALSKPGTCYNGMCLVGANGAAFEADSAEGISCRGYPEVLSPYPTKVVKAWVEPDRENMDVSVSSPTSYDAIPYDYVYGFEGVATCSPTGNEDNAEVSDDCVCSYDKAEYGEGATLRYYPTSTSFNDIPAGICSGGEAPGMACDPGVDGTCGVTGSCMAVTGKDTYLGIYGYCLERDTSIQIYGSNADQDRACLTWLPVDQLTGATNPYAKAFGAGFQGDTYYCADIETATDVGTTVGVACAETFGADRCEDGGGDWNTLLEEMDDSGDCIKSAYCPEGFFAVMTGCGKLSYVSSSVPTKQTCALQSTGGADCPFFCVPKMSFKTSAGSFGQEGDKCLNPNLLPQDMVGWTETFEVTSGDGLSILGLQPLKIYVVDDEKFVELKDFYDDCMVRGVLQNLENYVSDTLYTSYGGDRGYYDMAFNIQSYPACTSLVQVSSEDAFGTGGGDKHFNFAWTDRVWTSNDYAIQGADSAYFGYTAETSVPVFGTSKTPADMMSDQTDPYPPHVYSCTNDAGTIHVLPLVDGGCPQAYPNASSSEVGEEARAYFGGDNLKKAVDSLYASFTEITSNATGRLWQIFARPYKIFTFADGYDNLDAAAWTPGGFNLPSGETLDSGSDSGWFWDKTEDGDDYGEPNPPVVAAVGECFGSLCREGTQGRFSVNNQEEGNVTGQGSVSAVVTFFAWADSDQMPIRGINVDWGNGKRTAANTPAWPTDSQSGSIAGDNYYPNHRGLSEYGGDTTTTQCSLEDEWGMSSSACDSSYLTFKNAYVCNTGDPGSLPPCDVGDDGSLLNSPCSGGEVTDGTGACVFQPRVHVRDNWGWCTGTCLGEPGGDGCYDNSHDSDPNATDVYNECELTCPGTVSSGCSKADITSDVNQMNPWVYYDGYVIVEP